MKTEITTPEPNVVTTEYCGYTDDHLKTFMDEKEFASFCKWMNGQTCGLVDNTVVAYESDVLRFRNLYHNGTPTYWD